MHCSDLQRAPCPFSSQRCASGLHLPALGSEPVLAGLHVLQPPRPETRSAAVRLTNSLPSAGCPIAESSSQAHQAR